MSTADAVGILAEIQEKFPDEYKKIDELKDDPSAIEAISSKMSDEEKSAFLSVLMKAAYLGKKMTNLFELSVDEKKKLVKELKDFADFVELNLRKISQSE